MQTITFDSITALGLEGLELANNLHLFRWTGELIYGPGGASFPTPIGTAPEMDIVDWNLNLLSDRQLSLEREEGRSQPVPDEHVDEFRGDWGDRQASIAIETPLHPKSHISDSPDRQECERAAIVRPTPAAMFDAVQGSVEALKRAEATPAIAKVMKLGIWQPMLFDVDAIAQAAGRQWAQTIIAKTSLQLFQDGQLFHLQNLADAKVKAIRLEQSRWADKGRMPVFDIGGAIHERLTLVNLATCAVAIAKLKELGDRIYGFKVGAEEEC